MFKADNNLRSADAELQQRASEYLQLSIVASTDVLVGLFGSFTEISHFHVIDIIRICSQATVLEEMPPFPERESSILAILKKKKPGRVAEPGTAGNDSATPKERKSPALNSVGNHSTHNTSNQSTDLLGLTSPSGSSASPNPAPLVDMLADVFSSASPPSVNNGFGSSFQPIDNLKK